jgi:MFS family permease
VRSPTGGLVSLQSRDFRYLLTGHFLSLTGTQMQHVAVVWQLYLFTRSPLALGMLGFFRIAPVVLFALGGGVIADAFDRRRLMLVSQTVLALVSLTFAVSTYLGWANAYSIYGLTFLAGTAVAVDNPTRHALVPQLVPRQHLGNALSLNALVWQLGSIVGPPIAGWMLAIAGIGPIYLIDAASFLAVIAALLAMKQRARTRGGAQLSIRSALEGLAFIRRSPLIFSTMLLDFFATFFGGSMLLMPIFADQVLHVGTRGLGMLYSAQPLGAAFAAGALSLLRLPKRQGPALLVAVASYGAAIAIFGVSPYFWLSLLALGWSGASDAVSVVVRSTLRQMLTPDELRGRMTSVNMMFFMGGPQLGEVEAGAVAKAFGARFSVASGGVLCVLVAAVVAVISPALRRYSSAELAAPGAQQVDEPRSVSL